MSKPETKLSSPSSTSQEIPSYRVKPGPKRNGYQVKWVDKRAYAPMSQASISQVLDDFYDFGTRGYQYTPYLQFAPLPFKSSQLNIQRLGPHITLRTAETLSPSMLQTKKLILVLGGSSTFGWHVGDSQTIPSYLEDLYQKKGEADVKVLNLGRPYYSWNQEELLLQKMLAEGYRPNRVIFIDGINFGKLNPRFTEELTQLWEKKQWGFKEANPLLRYFPFLALVDKLKLQQRTRDFQAYLKPRYPVEEIDTPAILKSFSSHLERIDALRKQYRFEVSHIWQPHKGFECLSDLYSPPIPQEDLKRIEEVYRQVRQLSHPHLVNLSSLCQVWGKKPIFIDDVHYSPEFNAFMAQAIFSKISP